MSAGNPNTTIVYVARRDASWYRSGGGFAAKYHRIVGDFMSGCNPDGMVLNEDTRKRLDQTRPESLCRRCFPAGLAPTVRKPPRHRHDFRDGDVCSGCDAARGRK